MPSRWGPGRFKCVGHYASDTYRLILLPILSTPPQQLMDQHIRALAEVMLTPTTESGGHSFLLPIVDVLDEVQSHPPGCVASSLPSLQVASSVTTDTCLRWKCSLALGKVCSTHGILPTRYLRIGNLVALGDSPIGYGGSADVWRGEVSGCPVAVKVARRYLTMPDAQVREVRLHLRRGSALFTKTARLAILSRGSHLGKIDPS